MLQTRHTAFTNGFRSVNHLGQACPGCPTEVKLIIGSSSSSSYSCHASRFQQFPENTNLTGIACGHQLAFNIRGRRNASTPTSRSHTSSGTTKRGDGGVLLGCHRAQVLLNLLRVVQDVRHHPVWSVRGCCTHLPGQLLQEGQEAALRVPAQPPSSRKSPHESSSSDPVRTRTRG